MNEDESAIAIVGISCRFPGANNVADFWRNLAGGVESITRLSDDQILRAGVPPAHLESVNYVKAAPILEGPGLFDAAFFGLTPAEARSMDPQHRILLELASEALEDAGCDPDRHAGRIGVFAGSAMNTYFMNSGQNGEFAENYIPTLIGNDKDFLSTRISYKLNLKGPSLTVQTACSTSLVAVHLACQSLLSHESDMALAGAISVRVPHEAGYFCDSGGLVSPHGRVKAFDAAADGTVFGSGGGMITLKRLTDAVADGDFIHAVIRGSAMNNDGAEKAGYTAPSVNSQADAAIEAMANAGVSADEITYVEAHGSGTPVGDPIEIRALTKAFRASSTRSGYCAIGSVKPNIGHLDAAAGIAGIIKTVLALKHKELPPSLNYTQANPEIDFPSTPFYVNTRLTAWKSEGPRKAGVVSTGMGGTNAHLVLEEAPPIAPEPVSDRLRLIVLSARTEQALTASADRLRVFLEEHPATNLDAAAFTLQTGRRAMPHRRFVVAGSCAEIATALSAKPKRGAMGCVRDGKKRPLVLLVPGVGDHYAGMGRELYSTFPVFRREVDRCAEILRPHLGRDIREILFPKSLDGTRPATGGIDLKKMLAGNVQAPEDEETRQLNRGEFLQPALFTIEYALARLWSHLGVIPQAIVGHSMGEYVAATLAGVFSLEDALRLIVRRTQLVATLPRAAMLSVSLAEAELQPLLPAEVSIALINGMSLCVVAGPQPAIEELGRILASRDVLVRPVQNTHAFHSRMLDPIVNAFEAEVRKVRLNRPNIPYISNVTGRWASDAEALDPAYWGRHLNHTARFNDALGALWQMDNPLLLEAGPGKTLGVLAYQHPAKQNAENAVAIASLRQHYESHSDLEVLLDAVGKLWLSGAEIKWENLYPEGRRCRIPLPTYPFERENFWLSPKAASPVVKASAEPGAVDFERWFYVPSWERTAPLAPKADTSAAAIRWLIFSGDDGSDHGFRDSLADGGNTAELVQPRNFEDFLQLFRQLKNTPCAEIRIVHLGCFADAGNATDPDARATAADSGFFSLMQIAQSIGEIGLEIPVKIAVVSRGLHQVVGDEKLNPMMAPALGACGVIPKEFPNITSFNVDLTGDVNDSDRHWIAAELAQTAAGEVLAYRGRHRWRRKFVRASLAPMAPGSSRLRERGVYVITGGTGGIGLAIARQLAQNCRARLVLTKQGPFPDSSQWQGLLENPGTSAELVQTLRRIREIQDLGSEVEVMTAEASDREAMGAVLDATRSRFGTINGVIHGAGIVRAGLVLTKTRAQAESVLAPKVAGTWILHDLLAGAELDFLVLFSSLTAITTPFAESDYSGANAFLDAFAHFSQAERSYPVISINWPGWKEVGQLANLKPLAGTEDWKESALKKAISTREGVEAFQRALASGLPQVVVSPAELESEIREAANLPFSQHRLPKTSAAAPSGAASIPLHAEQLQKCVVGTWQQVLGFKEIGVDDSFFELGGHSLLLIQVHRELCRQLGRQISMLALLQHPTPKTLARFLSGGVASASGVEKARSRAERQRQAVAARNPVRN